MDDVLKYPIIPKRVYTEYKRLKRVQIGNTESLLKILQGLINDSKSKKNNDENILAKLILFDFKNYLSHPTIEKDNNSAKALEERIALLGEGKTSETFNKKDPFINSILAENDILKLKDEFLSKIASNFREKGDVIFFNSLKNTSYKISIKSLVNTNKEINFGAFEWTTLVSGILPDEYVKLGERKNNISLDIEDIKEVGGRGSRTKLLSLFRHIKHYGKWDEFIERLKILFCGVFKEDVLVYLKEYKTLNILVLSNQKFCEIFLKSVEFALEFPKQVILNRWEGNSIRMDRKLLLSNVSFEIKEDYENLFDEDLIKNKIQNLENLKYKELIKIFKS